MNKYIMHESITYYFSCSSLIHVYKSRKSPLCFHRHCSCYVAATPFENVVTDPVEKDDN